MNDIDSHRSSESAPEAVEQILDAIHRVVLQLDLEAADPSTPRAVEENAVGAASDRDDSRPGDRRS